MEHDVLVWTVDTWCSPDVSRVMWYSRRGLRTLDLRPLVSRLQCVHGRWRRPASGFHAVAWSWLLHALFRVLR
eukprot:2769517-Prymnesium_polylepis.1